MRRDRITVHRPLFELPTELVDTALLDVLLYYSDVSSRAPQSKWRMWTLFANILSPNFLCDWSVIGASKLRHRLKVGAPGPERCWVLTRIFFFFFFCTVTGAENSMFYEVIQNKCATELWCEYNEKRKKRIKCKYT